MGILYLGCLAACAGVYLLYLGGAQRSGLVTRRGPSFSPNSNVTAFITTPSVPVALGLPRRHKVIAFFPTARLTQYMAELCNAAGIPALEIHSRKSQVRGSGAACMLFLGACVARTE
jgi:hypothetical protein